jgi:hypothetical protein
MIEQSGVTPNPPINLVCVDDYGTDVPRFVDRVPMMVVDRTRVVSDAALFDFVSELVNPAGTGRADEGGDHNDAGAGLQAYGATGGDTFSFLDNAGDHGGGIARPSTFCFLSDIAACASEDDHAAPLSVHAARAAEDAMLMRERGAPQAHPESRPMPAMAAHADHSSLIESNMGRQPTSLDNLIAQRARDVSVAPTPNPPQPPANGGGGGGGGLEALLARRAQDVF